MSASSNPPPGYASDPYLDMLWVAPPFFTGEGTAGSGSPGPESNSFHVALPTVTTAMEQFLSTLYPLVDRYDAVLQQVQSAISGGTIFGQQATYNTVNSHINQYAEPGLDPRDAGSGRWH
jgi:hypothetical protein